MKPDPLNDQALCSCPTNAETHGSRAGARSLFLVTARRIGPFGGLSRVQQTQQRRLSSASTLAKEDQLSGTMDARFCDKMSSANGPSALR
eukprot:CAMPEP_0204427548 /NCGR_PEP_ID=MMETSP0470-20130426/55480_1 /ASSEMBLY_ACC=CAM_ASM_000385 /TAXON_ID=2969 /ORGANISM="Oxyrrhis marina" /LENGTH=89 /DNA_ID=CAMNT_0051425361 /DNA_START=14 /DNA_END=280 /DNA_ORIENTATION=-